MNIRALPTANAADVLVTAVLSYNGGGINASVNSGWTLLAAPQGTYSLGAAYQSVNRTGSYGVTWNGNGTPQTPSIILALKASGSSSSPTTSPTVSATAGTPQSATVNATFSTPLLATVMSGSSPVSGATVTFTAPGSGASASFSGAATATAVTNSSGIASAPALTSNSQSGSYIVTATVSGVSAPANFLLTNTAIAIASGGASSASLVQQGTGTNLGSNGNSLTVTLPRTPNNNNVLVLIFDQTGASQTITSLSGATWTRVGQNTSGGDIEIWTGTNPTSSTITITGTNYFGLFQPGYAIVSEFSGIAGNLDGSAVTTEGGTWPVNTRALTTTNAADLLVTAVLSYNGGGISAAVNSAGTLLAAPAGTYSLAAAYQSVTTAGSYTATWNGNGTPQTPSIILALK